MMEPFTSVTAVAAGIPIANIDTDVLFPAAYLKTVSRNGLANALFASLRADASFPLNRPPWDGAGILITLDNLGCGSSREHAVWALADFGVRCVIAPSFADIFRTNCMKNGILPVDLGLASVLVLIDDAQDAHRAEMTVDLEAKIVRRSCGEAIPFAIDPVHRDRLMRGADEISLSLLHAQEIWAFEVEKAATQPWLRPIPAELP